MNKSKSHKPLKLYQRLSCTLGGATTVPCTMFMEDAEGNNMLGNQRLLTGARSENTNKCVYRQKSSHGKGAYRLPELLPQQRFNRITF